ncbi:type II toxin-antitoxin system HipA family toxin [Burkholderia perseverans]|uniref:type II toxin-antitoxin system HipA family toxin n=1 Tax=Burkholderia perseverans TaxID=2615214 RepID=UPI001FEDBE9F|nr:type II toxin-antitoxin system HipA family toxin [Burkholderia perseverans]
MTPQGLSGSLVKESNFVFNYTAHERDREVSLIMPLRAESYAESVLMPVFAMNKPEGYLLDKLRERFGKYAALDDMRLLSITGGNQIGRLRYREPGKARERVDAEIGLDTLLSSGASGELFDYLVNQYLASGISGFQPKVMIPDADSASIGAATQGSRTDAGARLRSPIVEKTTSVTPDLIVKAAGEDYEFLSQNEFLCMSAARKAEIRVPDFWLSDDGSLFVMRRFDLEGAEQRSLGFEDMAVLFRRSADQKYMGSYEHIAVMIGIQCGENRTESLARYFEYITLSMMVRNGDAHLKNFGILYDYPGSARTPELAPLYDVVTTSVYPHQDPQSGRILADRAPALKLNKALAYPNRKTLLEFGRTSCGVAKPEEVVDRIASAMEEVLKMESHRIDSPFLEKIKAEWDRGMFSVAATRSFVPK